MTSVKNPDDAREPAASELDEVDRGHDPQRHGQRRGQGHHVEGADDALEVAATLASEGRLGLREERPAHRGPAAAGDLEDDQEQRDHRQHHAGQQDEAHHL
jgi:hypothetical protein